MNRVQFYPSPALVNLLKSDASSNGVSVSQFVTDLLENTTVSRLKKYFNHTVNSNSTERGRSIRTEQESRREIRSLFCFSLLSKYRHGMQ